MRKVQLDACYFFFFSLIPEESRDEVDVRTQTPEETESGEPSR